MIQRDLSPNIDSLVQFWSDIALKTVDWIHPWRTVLEGDFKQHHVRWFTGGQLNVSANCLDRHLASKAHHPALIWEGDSDEQSRVLSFKHLHTEVCKMSNLLKKFGIQKGDVVAIYLPMIPEAAMAMLASARIGAVHTVVFAGFSAHALKQRLVASNAKCLITADGFQRGGKWVALKENVDDATQDLSLKKMFVHHGMKRKDRLDSNTCWWDEWKDTVATDCDAEPMNAEDPLFILYTSGSTGTPKGLVHTTGGYLVQAIYTHKLIFDCQPHEIFWCTADIGWITGHSYVVYGSLSNGITSLMHEGIPTWPDPSRNWQMIDKHRVNVFYTAPTAIRTLMKAGDEWLNTSNRSSLRLLGSVGEPINPEAWQWYHRKIGHGRCPIVDTWWQTETGAIMISPTCHDASFKPGSAMHPIPGIVPVLLNEQGEELVAPGEGSLAIKYPWPSIARTIHNNHERYINAYLSKGYYITGDGAKRDEDGDYWITGRIDDVINVSGHRLSTAEIESALVTHPAVAEAAVVGVTHELKGQGIHAYVVLKEHYTVDKELSRALIDTVKQEISAIAKPDAIEFINDLPKTRSGKIMRRILRKIANKEAQSLDDLGDLSTLANPNVVFELMHGNHQQDKARDPHQS